MAVDGPQHGLDEGRVCLLVTGPPGSGKSTVGRAVAESLTRSALLEGDQVSSLVVGGHVWALGEPREEAARQVALCNRNLCTLADNFMAAGFTPIIDWVIASDEELSVFRDTCGDRLRLVVLDPDPATCIYRNSTRAPEERFEFTGYTDLRTSMQAGFGGQGWWLDSTTLTADETVQQVRKHANDHARVST